MISLFIGFGLISAILFWSIRLDYNTYLQLHSFVIVIGGTFAVLLFSNPLKILKDLYESILTLFNTQKTLTDYSGALNIVVKNKSKEISATHPLIEYASQLWVQGIDSELFIPLISQKRRDLEFKYSEAIMALKSLNKYPPALGMAGTVMGMITLFSNLDSSKDKIGSSLSIAMTATFFGLILSNMLISPLADRLQMMQAQQQKTLDALYEIILLINRDEADSLIIEELNERALGH